MIRAAHRILGKTASAFTTAVLPLLFVAHAAYADSPFVPVDGSMRCFAATYPAAQSNDNPTVTSLFLSLEDGEYGYYFWLDAEFSNAPAEIFVGGGTCRFDDGEFECPIDCDGGSFSLEAGPDGGVTVLADHGLRLEGPSDPGTADDDEQTRNFMTLPAPDSSRPYQLLPVSDEACAWDDSPS